jgi:hypothetical protein
VIVHAPDSRGAVAYRDLAAELAARESGYEEAAA